MPRRLPPRPEGQQPKPQHLDRGNDTPIPTPRVSYVPPLVRTGAPRGHRKVREAAGDPPDSRQAAAETIQGCRSSEKPEKVFLSEAPPLSPGLVLGGKGVWAGASRGMPLTARDTDRERLVGVRTGAPEKAKDGG